MGMLFLALSCIMDKDFPMDEEWMGKEAVRFTVLAEPVSKLSYKGVHTSFVDGESVGCVIAAKNGEDYDFKVSTEWTYQDGTLVLKSENDYVSQHAVADGYVTLDNTEIEYAFFFYCPYSEGVTADNWHSLERIVHTDFSKSPEARLSASDHLWTGYDHGMAGSGMKTVNLLFDKKTATVEIHCDHGTDYEISEVWIDAVSGSAGVQTEMHMNLTSGTLTVSDTEKGHDGLIKPGLVSEEDGSIHESGYRMIFVPQTILSWRLHAKITETDPETQVKSVQEYSIALEDKLKVLQEGKLYIFHVAKAGNGSILIRDWNSDNTDNLIGEEIPVPTELVMDAENEREDVDGAVQVKAGEVINITGTRLDIVNHLLVSGVIVNKGELDAGGFVLEDGKISFMTPDTATDGPVYLVMPSGVMVSPGNICTVKPVVTELQPASFDMNGYNAADPQSVTLEGTDLDLVESVIFGGGYISDAEHSNSSLTVKIPAFAQSGELQLVLKGGLVLDSGREFTVVNAHEEVKVTGISGRYKAGETITVQGLHLGAVSSITLAGTALDSFDVSDDGTTITFVFPEEATDGDMIMYEDELVIHTEEYKTVVPSYLDVQKVDDMLYVYGVDLDVVNTVVLNGNTMSDAHIEYGKIYFGWDDVYVGTVTLTTKHGKQVQLEYNFTPKISVTSIESELGYVYENVKNIVYAKPGSSITINGSNLDLANGVSVLENVVDSPVITAEQITFTFPNDVQSDGTISLTLASGASSVSVGSYVLLGKLPDGVSVTSIKSERDQSDDTDVVAKTGNVVTVYGTGLNDITSVQINDDVLQQWSLTHQDDGTQMSFDVPDTGDGAIKAYSSSKNEWFIIGNYETVVPVLEDYGRDNNWSVYVTGSDLDMVSTVVSPSAYNYSLQGDKYVIPVSNDIDKIKGTIVLATEYGKETNSLSYDFTPTGITYDKDYYAVNSNVTISGDNLDMIKSVEFAGAASPVTLYNAPGRTEFTVTVPSDAETGVLKFTLLDGSTVDGPELFIKKASISDINGLFKSGETVTVTGEYLDMITKVTVADQWGNNQITVGDKRLDNGNLLFTYPSASWQDGVAKIRFYVGDYNVVKEYVTILPVVSDITRDSNFIIIEGDNLDYVADVKLDDVSVSYACDETGYEGKITVSVMGAIKATAKLITKHGYEVGREYDFSPVVSTDLSTLGTKSPGNEFTIQGNNLDLVSVVYFTGGSSDDSPEASADGTSLLITVPEGAATGPIRLQVGNNNQYDVTTSSSITIGAQPTVTSVTGSTPGETVTVEGTNLNLITSVVVPVDGSTQTINNFTLENENTVLKFVLPNNACTGTMTFYQDQAIVHEHSLTVDSGTGGGNDPGTGDGEEIVLMESVEGLDEVTINDVSSLKAGCKLVINYTWPEPDNKNWGGSLFVEAGDKTWGQNEKVISSASFDRTSKHSFVITSDMLTKITDNHSKITIWKIAYEGIKITKVSAIKSVSE